MADWPLKHDGPCACRFVRRAEFGKAEQVEWCGLHATQRDEMAKMRHHLTELGKAADAAAMVIATIEAEDTTEEEKLQAIMDAIGTWAPDAIMTPNAGDNQPASSRSG